MEYTKKFKSSARTFTTHAFIEKIHCINFSSLDGNYRAFLKISFYPFFDKLFDATTTMKINRPAQSVTSTVSGGTLLTLSTVKFSFSEKAELYEQNYLNLFIVNLIDSLR